MSELPLLEQRRLMEDGVNVGTEHIIYVGEDMLGHTSPGIYGLDEEYAREGAERGHHYFFYDGNLEWLKPFEEERLQSLQSVVNK